LAGVQNLDDLSPALSSVEPIGFSIDSRTIRPGEVFFAVPGEVFDGHSFVRAAFERGAIGAVVSHLLPDLNPVDQARCLIVNDTLAALQLLARNLLKQWGRPIIGITGSAGKTTTKELTRLTLSGCGRVHASVGNLNNTYGLPLTVLGMISDGAQTDDYEYAVLEMGMSYPGEITQLCHIAPPHVSVVMNVAPVHLEHFTGIEGIAAAKAEIIHGLIDDGLAVLNADDPWVANMAEICHQRWTGSYGPHVVFFGKHSPTASVRARNIRLNGLLGSRFTLCAPQGMYDVELPLPGEHFIYNALAAAAVGLHFGGHLDSIALTLSLAKPAPHRGEILKFREGFTVVDDSYNSNPQALQQMTRLLASVREARRRILVAGEMLELGPDGAALHADCGRFAAQSGITMVIGVRGLAEHLIAGASEAGLPSESLHFVGDAAEAGELLVKFLKPGDVVLVKGSRGVKTERVLDVLKHRFSIIGQ
jgi:UDP-N-acetylmuramoyl-tripeptide--D-alanyl-D-alanine ligase